MKSYYTSRNKNKPLKDTPVIKKHYWFFVKNGEPKLVKEN